MKNTKYLCIWGLPIMWSIYLIFELITGRIENTPVIVGNIFLIILFALIGLVIYKYSKKYSSGFSTKSITFIFLLLMLIDQGIKIIIKLFFFDKYIPIINGFLSFNPIINTDGSWLNARFGTNVSFTLLISINIIALILFLEIYRYLTNKSIKSFWSDMCFLFIISGALCSLIDKIFYGGSLDFIGIGNLFIADIKDIYINLGILFFAISCYDSGYLNSDENTTFKEDLELLGKFFKFIVNDIKKIFKRK